MTAAVGNRRPERAASGTRRLALALFLPLLLASCAQPVHRRTLDESFLGREAGKIPWRKVAVLPFNGPPEYRRIAAEWLSFRVHGLGLFEVVDPTLAEIELKRKGITVGEADIPAGEARKAGQALGVDGIVFGSTTRVVFQGGAGYPTASASLLDVTTGRIVAASTLSRFVRTGGSRERVVANVDAVAEDLGPVFQALAGKPWVPHPKNEGGDGERPPGTR